MKWLSGLPQALFYGTGIPASILIINRAGAAARKEVLFINADHEYKEGKVQNTLRSEDIEKIANVDNSPPSEPHDVHAHLHGGIFQGAKLKSLPSTGRATPVFANNFLCR